MASKRKSAQQTYEGPNQNFMEKNNSTVFLGLYLLISLISTLGFTITFWPLETGSILKLPKEIELLLLTVFAGGLGSSIMLVRSFTHYTGFQGTIPQRWVWLYTLNPFLGMAFGTLFYIFIRGGVIKVGVDVDVLNPYTIAGFAALGGMFVEQIMLKLREITDTMFSSSRFTDLQHLDNEKYKE